MSFGVAIKCFFKALSNNDFSSQVAKLLAGEDDTDRLEDTKVKAENPETQIKLPESPARSDALTLLSTLQRESRLVDFLMEDISAYQDDQIGAAVRDIHQKAKTSLSKIFALKANTDQNEGESIQVPNHFDANLYELIGSIKGQGPYQGTISHSGWQAEKIELPEWKGKPEQQNIIAPIEVEVN